MKEYFGYILFTLKNKIDRLFQHGQNTIWIFKIFCHVINLSTWPSSQQPNDWAFVPKISFHCIIVIAYKFIIDEC
jgi:hypothetical protein